MRPLASSRLLKPGRRANGLRRPGSGGVIPPDPPIIHEDPNDPSSPASLYGANGRGFMYCASYQDTLFTDFAGLVPVDPLEEYFTEVRRWKNLAPASALGSDLIAATTDVQPPLRGNGAFGARRGVYIRSLEVSRTSWFKSLQNLEVNGSDFTIVASISPLSSGVVNTIACVGEFPNAGSCVLKYNHSSTSGSRAGEFHVAGANGSPVSVARTGPALNASLRLSGRAGIRVPITQVRTNGVATQSTSSMGARDFNSAPLLVGSRKDGVELGDFILHALFGINRGLSNSEFTMVESWATRKINL